MKLTDQEKQRVHLLYSAWVEDVSDDLENKICFSVDEIVNKVIEIVESIGEEDHEHS